MSYQETDYKRRRSLTFEQLEAFLEEDDYFTLDLTHSEISCTPDRYKKISPENAIEELKFEMKPKIIILYKGIKFV